MSKMSKDDKIEIIVTLDEIALALVEHGHFWSTSERRAYTRVMRKLRRGAGI